MHKTGRIAVEPNFAARQELGILGGQIAKNLGRGGLTKSDRAWIAGVKKQFIKCLAESRNGVAGKAMRDRIRRELNK